MFGEGANGKGTLTELIKSIIGDYATTAQAETLMQKSRVSGGEASPDIARLVDARAVMLAEGDRSNSLNEALVKQLTGQDTVTARELYGNPFEFQPNFKLLFSTNYLPKVRGTDVAIWRRLSPVPFTVSFTGNKMDKGLKQILEGEKSGVLNWMVEGCTRWQKIGLITPQAVLDLKALYQSDSDNVRRFLESMTISKPGATVPKLDLYKFYRNWVEAEGEHYTATKLEFSRIVKKQPHIDEDRKSQGRVWTGIELDHTECVNVAISKYGN
jgi:putative DNA primase/helicase